MSISYIDEYGLTQEVTTYTVVTSSDTEWTAGFYVVESNTVINNSVTVTGDVKLILADGVSLTVTAANDGEAGICVTNADPTATTGLNTFTVYGQTAGSGQLIATGGSAGAGIGGGLGAPGSHVTLAGGTVVATGGFGAAGIGGGYSEYNGTDKTTLVHGTDIKVTGGTVIATGNGGAGIGGGGQTVEDTTYGGKGERITITGGVVDAKSTVYSEGKKSGAGIGGGYGSDGNGEDITISGGTVIADGGTRGAGIGGGGYGNGINIKITGGSVTATSKVGAAIGGGYSRLSESKNTVYVNTEVALQAGTSQAEAAEISHTTDENIASTISGMTYAATQGNTVTVDFVDENGETQTLNGNYTLVADSASAVTWTEGYYVVGYDYNNDGVIDADDATYAKAHSLDYEFTITGGATVSGNVRLVLVDGFSLTVNASTSDTAGITVTNGDTAVNFFTVYGQSEGSGLLTATGGARGAGIGGGYGATGSHITLAGGTVVANGGLNAAGIGGGQSSITDQANGTDVTITGGTVIATGNGNGAGIGGGGWYKDGSTMLAGGMGKTIQVKGGVVVATGGKAYSTSDGMGGAGIGGGYGNAGGIDPNGDGIEITGGTVFAIGGTGSAGIGGGGYGSGKNITISGGTVVASSILGAGIGGGRNRTGYDITIAGGVLDASSTNGDAIGNSFNKTGSSRIYANTEVQLYAGEEKIAHTTGVDAASSLSGKSSVTASMATVSFLDENGKVQTIGGTSGVDYVVITGSTSAVTWTAGYYVVGADYNQDGVIDADDASYAAAHSLDVAFTITGGATVSGDVKLILVDGFSLTVDASAASGKAGVTVTNLDPAATTGLNTFTVYGQTVGSGQLIATGGQAGAGIGGGYGAAGSHITLTGGTVIAQGGLSAAGIGGGCSGTAASDRGNGTDILITGGTVIATGGKFGAGIGGGRMNGNAVAGGVGSDITIQGGVVAATGGTGAAGIGGGFGNVGTDEPDGDGIEITGGTVFATGGTTGAGIGGGEYGQGKNITISGGTVVASSTTGAGIGGGGRRGGEGITITGGVVEAQSSTGAGIGGGWKRSGKTINISGGVVTASSESGDAIGNSDENQTTSSGIYVDADVRVMAGTSQAAEEVIIHTSETDLAASLSGQKNADTNPIVPVGVSYVDENGELQTVSAGKYTYITSSDSAVTWGGGSGTTTYYVVGADYNQDGIVDAADAAYAAAHSFDVAFTITGGATVSGNVKLIVADGFSLTVDASATAGAAGITVTNGDTAVNTFTVYSQSASSGQLIVTGGSAGAGIGGGYGAVGSHVTLAGGTVVATGGTNAAGIGGGQSSKDTQANGTNVTITGGTVIATGNGNGAGIGGGGWYKSGSTMLAGGMGKSIEISGGVVVATGGTGGADTSNGTGGAGIGGGFGNSTGKSPDGDTIEITGGTVFATGASGAGIGGGEYGYGRNITISGGTVVATSTTGAGIGGGARRAASGIVIQGGVVVATTGGTNSAAIGRGNNGLTSETSINVDANWELQAGASSEETSVIAHTSIENLATKLKTMKYASSEFKTVTVAAGKTVNATGGLTYQAVSGNAFTVEAGGVLNLAGGTASTTFSGNTVAIQNAGTVNVQGAVTLATAGDTIEGAGAINWDLTAGSSSNLDFSISDWSKVTATGAKTVTVASGTAQYGGSYALADNVSGDFAITLKGLTDEYTLSLNGTSSVTVDGTYYGLSKTAGTVSLLIAEEKTVGGTATTYCGGTAARITGGTTTRMFIGGSKNGTTTGSCTVSITDGSLTKSLAAGDAASGQAVGQTGDLTLTIEGGTFGQRVAGGMYAADSAAVTELDGSVTLTIKGGTFTGRIYGGSNAQQDAYGGQNTIEGSVSTLVDSSTNKIVIQNYLIGGSRGAGRITGDVTVTFTGLGSNLSFNGGTSVVAGGSNADTVKIYADGSKKTTSTVDGSRNLVFDAFTGNFGADLRLFSTATFKNSSAVTLTDTRVNLWTVETWNFEYGSSLTGLLANDFDGDRLNFDVTGLTTESDWTVATGDVKAFDDLNDAAAVYFGDSLASFDSKNSCWTDNTYKLALNSDKTAMIVSKIA